MQEKYNHQEKDPEPDSPTGKSVRGKKKMVSEFKKYNPSEIESRWQRIWKETGIYKTKDLAKKPKFYALDFFPYPSGDGLHVGHTKGYAATDAVSRMKMMEGFNVLHPMGWDAFGLPAENYAIKNKIHPRISTEKNIATFRKQLHKIGFTYDWDREVSTIDPEFYKWTQWIFLKMFEKGLAYESDEPVNWCSSCKTVLANEDLENGACERCGTQVVQKKMKQWVLKMTAYADRLLYDLDSKDLDWEELIKEQQRNWIGRSEGITVKFEILISNLSGNPKSQIPNPKQASNLNNQKPKQFIEVFTTRMDTIFGCTYCVVAPEHKLISELKGKIENYPEIEKYIIAAQNKTNLERTELQKEKTGVELKGVKTINPFTGEEIPVWVADYVLGFYGTGAVMAVPAHDERDFEFAKKYNLPIKQVIEPNVVTVIAQTKEEGEAKVQKEKNEILKGEKAFCHDGVLINSEKFDGLKSEIAREEMAKWLEEKGIGKKKVNYKMRDWVFSRQRYWGEPIPLIFCPECRKLVENYKLQITNYKQNPNTKYQIKNTEFSLGEIMNPGWIAVDEKDLPVKLPEVESYEPTGTGESPLANIKEWVNVKCPKCGGAGKRETNTMPQWAGSSWYYLAYIMRGISNFQFPISKYKEEFKKWLPVDLYVGGAEHATRHLLYARFWHKFLYDIGAVSTEEPFRKLFHVGLILAEDGRKMSKRWGNVINPDDVIGEFGADSFRLYEMFMGPFSHSVSWSTKGVIGMRRFLDRIWSLRQNIFKKVKNKEEKKETILIATNNEGKLKELKNHLKDFKILSLKDIKEKIEEPEETGKTFKENSFEKAKYYAEKTGFLTVADDSGLCINALGGEPGVFSSRYAEGEYKKAHRKILKRLEGAKDRSAYFQSIITLYDPKTGKYDQFEGMCRGSIADKPCGNGGFGYDPIFIPNGFKKTFGECSPEEKYQYDHRKKAIDKMTDFLRGKSGERKKIESLAHKTIKKVSEDVEGFKFNTAISALMILSNEFERQENLPKEYFEKFLILLSPFAPHIAEELWSELGNKKSIFLSEWPKYDSALAKDEEIEMIIQVNGKLRDKIKTAIDITEEDAKKLALASENAKKTIQSKEIKKIIFVKGKLINLVI